MPESRSRRKNIPNAFWRSPIWISQNGHPEPPDLRRQLTYDHAICEFVGWYCSEPRLAFNPHRRAPITYPAVQHRCAPIVMPSSP